jgi:hypothetical protein
MIKKIGSPEKVIGLIEKKSDKKKKKANNKKNEEPKIKVFEV